MTDPALPGARAAARLGRPDADNDRLLTPAEVGALFGVTVKTVGDWAKAGRLTWTPPLGGHRSFSRAEIMALIDASTS